MYFVRGAHIVQYHSPSLPQLNCHHGIGRRQTTPSWLDTRVRSCVSIYLFLYIFCLLRVFSAQTIRSGYVSFTYMYIFNSLYSSVQVDTRAQPPRSIWIHPLHDPQFIAEHPEYQRRDEKEEYKPPSSPRPVSWDERVAQASTHRKRGFFGRLKDKTIGTKEEREAEKRRVEAVVRSRKPLIGIHTHIAQREQRRQQMLLRQEQYRQQQQQFYQQNPGYAHPSGFSAPVYAPPRRTGGFGGGFGGAGLPLLGGLAGGLLLGEALDGFGDGGFGGGFGDGGFGDGGFGGF